MATKSSIQWTDATWNIARGCTKVDEDCKYCYMYRDSFDNTRYNPLEVIRTKTVFNFPLKYKETKSNAWDGSPLIFTSSLTDVFHPAIDAYRNEMWNIISRCPHLTFQILTKRPERIADHLPDDWGTGYDNVWLGTSCGSQKSANERIPLLLESPAKIRFLSCEPLWSDIKLKSLIREDSGYMYFDNCLSGFKAHGAGGWYGNKIDWVIVGGESGNDTGKYRYRPCEIDWIEKIVSDCEKESIPVFVKQLGTYLSKQLKMSDRHGGNINEFPKHLQIREFPSITK